ncbi:MAG TPA: dienelactone hydrolase family protein [Polyangiaceae bacterium]|nr:dienelactone hydrolase family protein [Polyangiaceae bacterium]
MAAPSVAPAGAAAVPELQVARLGPLREDERGGQLVVLLHGWRAHGDDLVSLARELARPGTRFLVPAAPLPEPNGGRAWWRLDSADRPAHVSKDELPASYRPNAQLAAARGAVQALLRDARERYAPSSIAVVGFSQGAMLALDLGLSADPPIDRVAVLSGVLVADSLPALHAKRGKPSVFVSHGRSDPVLPFAEGASIESLLKPYGVPVTFVPFEGGHQIPAAVVEQLRAFLAAGAR